VVPSYPNSAEPEAYKNPIASTTSVWDVPQETDYTFK